MKSRVGRIDMSMTKEDYLNVGDMILILKNYPNDFEIDVHDYDPVIFIRDTDGNIVESIGVGD